KNTTRYAAGGITGPAVNTNRRGSLLSVRLQPVRSTGELPALNSSIQSGCVPAWSKALTLSAITSLMRRAAGGHWAGGKPGRPVWVGLACQLAGSSGFSLGSVSSSEYPAPLAAAGQPLPPPL